MNIQSNDLILDVGTGTGDITNMIHKYFSKSLIMKCPTSGDNKIISTGKPFTFGGTHFSAD